MSETATVAAVEVTVTAAVASFRNPLYAAVQVGLPCPPPATVGGLLAAAAGSWDAVPERTRFAMAFQAGGSGTDLETYHPLAARGAKPTPKPALRDFLADVTLTIWLLDDLDAWQRRLRRPAWPLRLGRSQDLAAARCRRVALTEGHGRQGQAVLPAEHAPGGLDLRLPTAVSMDRSRTRWDHYRYAAGGDSRPTTLPGLVDGAGQAVVLLPPVHPATAS